MVQNNKELAETLKGKLKNVMAGKDLILSIWDITGETLLAVAGQQSLTINRDGDTIEVTSKDSEGWKEFIMGFKEWSMDQDGIYVLNDASHKLMGRMFDEGDPVLIKVTNKKEEYDMFAGMALITSYPLEAPYDDSVTFTTALQGTGKLVDLTDDEDEEEENNEELEV